MPSKITKQICFLPKFRRSIHARVYYKTQKKMHSVPPVSLYFWDPVLQAEYQRFIPDFTTKFQKKKWAAFRLYLYVFWNRSCRQSTSAYQISYIFLLSFGTNNKNKKTASHGCAEIPAGIPAGIPQLTGRWQKKKGAVPRCTGPQRHGGGFGPQVL